MEQAFAIVATTLALFEVILCQDNVCFDCCTDTIIVYHSAELCIQGRTCSHGIWSDREGVIVNPDLRGEPWENATSVKIFPNAVSNSIRRCTVQNFERLDTILAEDLGISVIEVRAFWNLKSLRYVYLAFNFLKEVQYGVFSYQPISYLDLSWNKIVYIGENAFTGMTNLKTLDMSYNELTNLDLQMYNLPIKELRLSHNFLDDIEIGPELNLSVIDLSFNRLTLFELDHSKSYHTIDLTNNYLSEIVMKECMIKNFKLGLNNLTSIDPLVQKGTTIGTISLFPNPWNCDQLNDLLEDLRGRKVRLLKPEADERLACNTDGCPVCANVSAKAYEEYDLVRDRFVRNRARYCKLDNQCPVFMKCRNQECWEPCKANPCKARTKLCETRNHKFSCRCPKGQLKHPYVLFAECEIPCYIDRNCPQDYYCAKRKRRCVARSVTAN